MTATIRTSYHTHSHYCDGEGEIAEVIEAAITAGLHQIGISSHAPLPFETDWTMPHERLAQYAAEVRELQMRYRDRITVLFGAEIDYIPGEEVDRYQRQHLFPLEFDYFVGSVHFLGERNPPSSFDGTAEEFRRILDEEYAGDIAAMVTDYYRRMQEVVNIPGVRIVGHLDRIKRFNAGNVFFNGDEPWYREAVNGTLRAVAGSGLIMELNTSGWRHGLGAPYPSPEILARAHDLGIPITVNSDAHTPNDVNRYFDWAADLLEELGIQPVTLGNVTAG